MIGIIRRGLTAAVALGGLLAFGGLSPTGAAADGGEFWYPVGSDYNWIGACATPTEPTELVLGLGIQPSAGGDPLVVFDNHPIPMGSWGNGGNAADDPDFPAVEAAMESGGVASYFLTASYSGCTFTAPIHGITLPADADITSLDIIFTPPQAGQTDVGFYRVGPSDFNNPMLWVSIVGFTNDPWLDTDGDGLADQVEIEQGTDPESFDSDGDGFGDLDELFLGLNGSSTDTDGDGLLDADEASFGSSPAHEDFDLDGLLDDEEVQIYGTNPLIPDTDYDGLRDGIEVHFYHTNPANESDEDGLDDGQEILLGTDPFNSDTDGDTLGDGMEVALGLDPLDADTDDDGLPDTELLVYGTDAFRADTDFDGLSDGFEVLTSHTSPTNSDSDADGISDGLEVANGSNPLDPDTDGDLAGDISDNCVLVPNTMQEDLDHDGLGDPCDPDDDADTVPDASDNCPVVANINQLDIDSDGAGDPCDLDDDGDTVPDSTDNCPVNANASQLDTDGDGLGNPCDPDDDGDAVLDGADSCPLVPAASFDADADGCRDTLTGFSNFVAAAPMNALVRDHLLDKTAKVSEKLCTKGNEAAALDKLDEIRQYILEKRGPKLSGPIADILDAYVVNLIAEIDADQNICTAP